MTLNETANNVNNMYQIECFIRTKSVHISKKSSLEESILFLINTAHRDYSNELNLQREYKIEVQFMETKYILELFDKT